MKLKRLFSGLLVSLIAIVSVLLCVKVSSAAAEESVGVLQFSSEYNSEGVNSYGNNWSVTKDGRYYEIKNASNYNNDWNYIKMGQKKTAYVGKIITSSYTESISKVVMKIDKITASAINSIKLYVKDSSSNVVDTIDGTKAEGDCSFTISNPSSNMTYSIEVDCTASGSNGVIQISKVEYFVGGEAPTDYNVSFDANGAAFATGKGEPIKTAVGTDRTVTLPTFNDIECDYKNIVSLTWSDGKKTYNPGQQVTVSSATTFTAVYTISVEEAIDIAEVVGTTATAIKFTVLGIVTGKVNTKNNNTTFDIMDFGSQAKLKVYRASKGEDISDGDYVKVTGTIINYNNNTPEINAGGTYVKFVPAAEEFEKVETMSSLSFDWATDGNDYTVSNVSLRFGNLFTKDAYAEGATYGVLLIQNSDLAGSDFATYLAGKTLKEINDDSKIINVEATPVKVNAEGVADENGEYYQFAAVLSDMDKYLTASVTAVMYVVIDGQIYYSVEKTASVKSTADAYFKDAALMETLDENVQHALLTLTE